MDFSMESLICSNPISTQLHFKPFLHPLPPAKTTAGILLLEKFSKLNTGKIVAVGPGLRDESGNHVPVAVKEGDTVLLPDYGGTQVKLDDKEFHLFRDEDILGVLHE